MSKALEILTEEITQRAETQLAPRLNDMVRRAFETFRQSEDAVLTVPQAQRIFNVSRQVVEQVLVESNIPVRFHYLGGKGEAKVFIYRDFAAGLRGWIERKA